MSSEFLSHNVAHLLLSTVVLHHLSHGHAKKVPVQCGHTSGGIHLASLKLEVGS